MVKIGRNCNEHSMNIFHFFAIDFCEWARPGGGAANGQNRPKYGGFPPCLRRTRGRTARAGFPCAQARTGGKSIPVRQGFGRRRAGGVDSRGGRGRKISQRAGQDGAGGLPLRAGPDRWKKYAGTAGFWPPRGGRAGAGAQNQSARGAGRRGRASPARRPGPVEKVCRYGRVLAAGRARKIGQRARDGGRTWSGGSIIAQAGESPRGVG